MPVIRRWTGAAWQDIISTAAGALSSLQDVTITNPVTGSVIRWNGGAWVNAVLTKADVGLGNVDNTSDAAKPISTSVQTALDAKAASVHTHTKSQISDFSHTHAKAEITDFAHSHPASDLTATGTKDATTFLRGDNTWAAPPTGGGSPTGAAGGDLAGTYPNPTIANLAVTDAKVAAANKDGAAGTPSMRTLGTGATQAAAGNDARLSDARTPLAHTHPASDLTATGTRNATTFLRGDNTWGVPPDTNTTYATQTQAEAESSTDTNARLTTGQRLYQAISKWAVTLAGAQTITGAKTFSIPPAVAALGINEPATIVGDGVLWYDEDDPGGGAQTDAAALTTGTLANARLPSTVPHVVFYTGSAWPARPANATTVHWVGPVPPTMTSTDMFTDTSA